MKRVILTAVLCALFASLYAKKPADEIKEIMKNSAEYISVESTSPDEHEAYVNALRQMIDMARNFVEANNDGKPISDNAIESVVKKIVTSKGDFKRVFLYAQRSDLIARSNQPEQSEPNNGQDQGTDIEPVVETPTEDFETVPESEPEQEEDFESDETFEEELPEEIVEAVNDSFKVSNRMQTMIDEVQECDSLEDAAEVIYRYLNRALVTEYGPSRKVENSDACFWVVENNNGTLSILAPEIRGHRYNFRTGKVDALHRYSHGFWFRTR